VGPDGTRPRPVALLTDLWYTLVYYSRPDRARVESARDRIWREALASAGMLPAEARRTARRIRRESRREERQGRTPPLADLVRSVARSEGIPLRATELVGAFDRLLLEHPPRLVPGAIPALRTVRRRTVRVGLVSNVRTESSEAVHGMLRALGIRPLLDVVVLSADDGVAKPDPRPVRRALDALEVDPGDAWFVGDSADDERAARRAGVAPLRFAPGGGVPRLDPRPLRTSPGRVVLRRWRDLPGLLASGADRTAPLRALRGRSTRPAR
jgi:FMN phosphatase YigB (HAD superfamily)